VLLELFYALTPIGSLGNQFHVGLASDEGSNSVAEEWVVIHDEDTDRSLMGR
jgi:hypothetical protein